MFLGKHSNTWAWAALGCQRDFQVPPDYPSWDANTRFHGGSTVWSVKLEALDISGLQLHPPLATPVPLCPGLGEGLREPPTAQVCREALGRGASSAPSVCHCYKTAAQESRKQRAPSSQALGSGPSAQPRLSLGLSFLICMLRSRNPSPRPQVRLQAQLPPPDLPTHTRTHTHTRSAQIRKAHPILTLSPLARGIQVLATRPSPLPRAPTPAHTPAHTPTQPRSAVHQLLSRAGLGAGGKKTHDSAGEEGCGGARAREMTARGPPRVPAHEY